MRGPRLRLPALAGDATVSTLVFSIIGLVCVLVGLSIGVLVRDATTAEYAIIGGTAMGVLIGMGTLSSWSKRQWREPLSVLALLLGWIDLFGLIWVPIVFLSVACRTASRIFCVD